MSESGNRIRDDRGRSVTQLDPVMLHVLHRYDTIDATTLEVLVEEIEPGTAAVRRRLIYLLPIFVLTVISGIVVMYVVSDASARKDLISTLLNPVIMGGGIIGGGVVPWIATRQQRFKLIRTGMLRHHRCPHCGYNLHGLTADPGDGATVCPECGCAWRLDTAHLSDGSSSPAAVHPKRSPALLIATMIGLLLFAILGAIMALRF